MTSKSDQMKALQYLERMAIFVCMGAMTFGSYLLWETHQFNKTVSLTLQRVEQQLLKQQKHNTRQDIDIAEMKGQMVTWDTLKRIELFLSTHPEHDRGRLLGDAIRIEVDGRRARE